MQCGLCRTGVLNLWDQMSDDLRWIWCNSNKVQNKYYVLETIPHPRSMEKWSSTELVPGARKVGDSAVGHSTVLVLCGCLCRHLFFSPLSSCSQSPCFWSLFSLYTMVQNLFGGWGIPWAEFSDTRRILDSSVKNLYPFLFQIHFYPFLSQQKFYGINITMLCGEKRKTFCSLSSAGNWRVLGPCVVVHKILAFFPLFSVYWAQRVHYVSIWIWTVNIYQHVSVYFLLFKKGKNTLKMGFIEG